MTDEEVNSCFELVVNYLRDPDVAPYLLDLRIIIAQRAEFVSILAEELRQ